MILRDVTLADFSAIAALTNHYIATTVIHFGIAPVSAAELAAGWREHPEHPYLVAVDERGALLGYAKTAPWRTREAYKLTAEAGIYVQLGAERRGIGKQLYARLFDELRARGFHSVLGCITLPNDASLALHRGFGFVDAGTVREAGFKFGAWHDVAFVQKIL